jgi:hemoglobin
MKQDIHTAEDIELLVYHFYSKVLQSSSLYPFFKDLNWDAHLPSMKKFWRFILLDEAGYTENVTQKHLHMTLTKELFTDWLLLFHQTVDEYFEGPKATLAKTRATLIGLGIQGKMNLLKD